MGRFLARRSFLALLTLFAVSVLTFGMFFVLPRDPVTGMCPKNCDPERLERVRQELGLSDPKVEQYLGYIKGIFVGRDLGSAQGGHCDAPCLGYSYVNNEPVSDTIARVLPVTVSIVVPAAILWLSLGIGLGMISAVHRGTWLDRAATGFALTGASLQLYFVGGVLLLAFTYHWGIAPVPHYTVRRRAVCSSPASSVRRRSSTPTSSSRAEVQEVVQEIRAAPTASAGAASRRPGRRAR